MRNRSVDRNMVIAIACGGFVIAIYGILQTAFRFWFIHTILFEDYIKETIVTTFAGFTVMLFAVVYGAVILSKKQANFEQIWEENCKSMVKLFLSAVDDDFIIMNRIFEKLDSEGFDSSRE